MNLKNLLIKLPAITLGLILLSCGPASPTNPEIDGADGRSISLPTSTIRISELMAANTDSLLSPDYENYDDWIELSNSGDDAIDISGFFLTDAPQSQPQKWVVPENTLIPAKGHIVIWADGHNFAGEALHTNFKLSQNGEEIALISPHGDVVDSLEYPKQIAGISYGLNDPQQNEYSFFGAPTPGESNIGRSFSSNDRAIKAEFSLPAGRYNGNQLLVISANEPDSRISVTTDGSIPRDISSDTSVSLEITRSTTIRARVYSDNALPGKVKTRTYLIDEDSELAIISLTTDPRHLYNNETGIYIADAEHNSQKGWERPAHIEYFDEHKDLVLSQGTALEMYGNLSRTWPIKSLGLKAKEKYGAKNFDYPFFEKALKNPLQSLVIRGTSFDQFKGYVRDPLMQSVIAGKMQLDHQSHHPVVLYLNGEYQGLRYLRDRVNRDYLNSYYDLDQNDTIINNFSVNRATQDIGQFQKINDYVATHDLRDEENYRYLSSQVDLNSFINFLITQIYAGNFDSMGNNNKFWRDINQTLPWKWFLFDLDHSFSICDKWGPDLNMLEFALENTEGKSWPNPPNTTLLFRKLIENPVFLSTFTQRLASHLNTTFDSERVIQLTDMFTDEIISEMPDHLATWGKVFQQSPVYFEVCWTTPEVAAPVTNMEQWNTELARIKNFAAIRPNIIRSHLIERFGPNGSHDTNGWVNLRINNADPDLGGIKIAGVALPQNTSFSGQWLMNIPLKLEAIPKNGRQFLRWQGDINSEESIIELILKTNTQLEAIFE